MSTDSPYRRDNFFGDPELEQPDHNPPSLRERARNKVQNDAAETAAHSAFKAVSTILCKRALEELNEEIELTDPEYYPPGADAGTYRHARRCNPETGWLNWGEGTGIAFKDVSEEELIASVEAYLTVRQESRERVWEGARQFARSLKTNGDIADINVLKTTIQEVRDGAFE